MTDTCMYCEVTVTYVTGVFTLGVPVGQDCLVSHIAWQTSGGHRGTTNERIVNTWCLAAFFAYGS